MTLPYKKSPVIRRGKSAVCCLLLQIAEQVFPVHAVCDQLGKAVDDGLLVLSVGHAEPLVVGGQHLDADLVRVQQLIIFNVAVMAAGFIWAFYRTGTGKAKPTVSYEMA